MGLHDIQTRIREAEVESSRASGSVTLIAVSKVQPAARVTAVLEQGQRVFGENYLQEAQRKWPDWRRQWPDVRLHMIGPLQSNKAKAAFDLFDAIHTVDRPSLVTRLAKLADQAGRQPELLVQVNTGREPQKAGILPEETDAFLRTCNEAGLTISGLMCIPPDEQDPRPHFRLLREMAEANGLPQLSMGMSADFEAAIAEGATYIRVGSAIFGARDYG